MNRYPLLDLVRRWEREEITIEQVIGQILLWLDALSLRVTRLEATPDEPRVPKKS
jgi:hypothetical protein